MLIRDLAAVISQYHGSVDTGNFVVYTGNDSNNSYLTRLLTLPKAKIVIINSYDQPRQFNSTDQERYIILTTLPIFIDNTIMTFDTMTSKQPFVYNSGGVFKRIGTISQSRANNRAQTTMNKGIIYRAITNRNYNRLEKYNSDQLFYLPIFKYVIDLINRGLIPSQMIELFGNRKVTNTVKMLLEINAITPLIRGQMTVTDIGNFISKTDLSARNGATLQKWIETRLPVFPGVVVLTLIDSYDVTYFRFSRNRSRDIAKFKRKFGGDSDVETMINLWNQMMNDINGNYTNYKSIRTWCKNNFVDSDKMIDVVDRIVAIYEQIEQARPKTAQPFTSNGVITSLVPILNQTYRNQIMTWNSSASAITYTLNNQSYLLDKVNGVNNFVENTPSKMIGLVLGRTRTTNLILVGISAEVQSKSNVTVTTIADADLTTEQLLSDLSVTVVEESNLPSTGVEFPPLNEEEFPPITYGPNGFFAQMERKNAM
jgi:hypothetical protein